MLQQEKPDDYLMGTGEPHSVREFMEAAFPYMNLDWQDYVEIDYAYFRPTEFVALKADSSKAKRELGWAPKVSFKDLVKIMLDADLEAAGLSSPGEGRKIISDKGLAWNEHR